MRRRWAAAALRVAAVGLVAAALLACGRQEPGTHHLGSHRDLDFLEGLLVSDRPVVALPGARWGGNQKGGKWTFKGAARIYCMVQQERSGPLVFYFTPDETTADLWFNASWDDRPLFDEPQRPAYGENAVTIPPELVTPGLHQLTVERVDRLTPPDLKAERSNRFSEVGFSVGRNKEIFDLSRNHWYRYMAMLVARGVTGATLHKMSGCLFDGPLAAVADVGFTEGGVLSFEVENASGKLATFAVEAGGQPASVEVAPRATETLDLPVDSGRVRLRMAVDGTPGGLFLWGMPHVRRPAASDLPTIVIVTLDTTRRDALSMWGAPPAASPHLSEIASHATVFDNAWAVAPWTLPSHATIFTGLYPYRHGAGVWEDHLPLSFETVAEILSGAGYFTAGFAGGVMSAASFGVAQGFDLYVDPDGWETRADALVDAVEDVLEGDPPGPLHLFVNFFDPHGIYQAPAEFQSLFDVERLAQEVRDLPVWHGLVQGHREAWGRLISGEGEVTREALSYLRASYLAEVAFMDDQIGRLMSLLKDRGLYESALIILVSDHGELLGEGGYFSHCCRLDSELMLAPLVIKWPHQRDARRVEHLVSQVDLFATILEAAGVDGPPRDGLPLAESGWPRLESRREVFMEEHESRIHPLFENMTLARHSYGIQQLRWRELVWDGGMLCQEEADGWRDAACSADWSERLAWLDSLVGLPLDEGVSHRADTLSDDEQAKLKALGYVR